jgi:hypothetical protein
LQKSKVLDDQNQEFEHAKNGKKEIKVTRHRISLQEIGDRDTSDQINYCGSRR